MKKGTLLTAAFAAAALIHVPMLSRSLRENSLSVRTESAADAVPVSRAPLTHSALENHSSSEASVPPSGHAEKLSRPGRLTGVIVQPETKRAGTAVEISTSRAIPYRVLRLRNPSRLVVDLEGARNAANKWVYPAATAELKRIRIGRFSEEFGGVIRVVADLKGDPVCQVSRNATGIRIDIKKASSISSQPSAVGRQQSAKSMVSTPPPQKTKISAISYEQLAKLAATAPPLQPKTLLERKAQVVPIHPVRVRAVQEPPLQGNPVTSRAPTSSAQPRYTGKCISLNLKNVDLKDFFRLIHEVSGLNIIVDPNVSGSVTTVLDNVPWDQALDLVLKDNELGKQLEGNVLRIATVSTLSAEQKQDRQLADAREEAEPLVTVFRRLSYAKATTLAALLKSWTGGGALSRRGTVLVDDRTNTLIISDIASQIPLIDKVIDKLDRKAQQVSIQARIIRATSDFARNLGVALSYAQNNRSGSVIAGGATGPKVSAEPTSPPSVLTSAATGFGVFVLSNLGANYSINAAIAAAETRDEAKTISRPSIVTQNNVEGTVIQGTQIPIQTTINNTISIQYIQASLQLKVTPQVTQDGNIFLTIDVQNSSPGPALTFAGPSINTQSATTEVLVPNGGTVVFGGVTVNTRSKSSTAVPLLGNVPLLGHLFKNSNNSTNDQELLFFVTPKVLPT